MDTEGPRHEERIPYHICLRAIGSYLDERGANAFNVLELNEGFNVRFDVGTHEPQLSDRLFSREELGSMSDELQGKRTPIPSQGESAPLTNAYAYQNFLRALGHELDKIQAFDILLEQVEDNTLLTFIELDPAHGIAAHKRMMLLGPDDRTYILEHSYRRRKEQPPPKLLQRFGRSAR